MASRFKRVNQWLLFSRQWHVVDATHQDIHKLSERVAERLCGKYKPIWDRETDCGDNVVVLNTKHASMHAFDWKRTIFKFDRTYPRSKNDLTAAEIHEYDPCRVFWMTTYRKIHDIYFNSLPTRSSMERLHLFAETDVPTFIKNNIASQLESVQEIPKKSTDYTAEERARFPRIVHFDENHVKDWENPLELSEETYRKYLVELDIEESAAKLKENKTLPR